ncbi:hypothetical protein NQ314_013921, partial [Rhamnusium bicolor]
MESLEKICRLCLKNCYDNSEVINELMKEVFNTHLLENNPAISEEPVVCTNCAEIMQKCFDFKSTCFSTQDCIAPFLNKNNEKLDLKDIYLSKEENKNVIEISDDYNLCPRELLAKPIYKQYKDYYSKLVLEEKLKYHDELIKTSENKSKTMWQIINLQNNRNKPNSNLDELHLDNGKIITSPAEM